ncbi:MAG: gliding motility-associated ABC transporter substrate-binding protein GldG [Flavobacteriaceae bacterium]|nr:gliding motility-associated ABC transporter substrate-binding protein GldG [Flavobacteriaceae bacterium]
MAKRPNIRFQSLTGLLLATALLLVLNLLSQQFFLRLDLTAEKRYTLAKPSRDLAKGLKDVAYFKIYLEGDFPAGYKHLQKATLEILEEYRAYAGANIEFEFEDPFEKAGTQEEKDKITEQLYKKGLQPMPVKLDETDELSTKTIIPGAVVSYQGKEFPLNLMRQQFFPGANNEEELNKSVENLEYCISDVLRKCVTEKKKRIGFTAGHGELPRDELASAANGLMESYDVERIKLQDLPPVELNKYDVLVVAKPDSIYNPYERFKLDQYVMHGGKVLWLVENVVADMDSISRYKEFLTPTIETGLEELLFKYGARVNYSLLSDLQCNFIPVIKQMQNGQPGQDMVPWTFYPILSSTSKHPIVKNLEPVWGQFTCTIDTVGGKGIRKTVLLSSSDHSRTLSSPVMISIKNSVVRQQDVGLFNKANLPVSVLLEGKFKSFFANYTMDSVPAELDFKSESPESRMIVVGDGDIIRNQVKRSTGEIYPLGYDRYTRTTFGNMKFIQNCIDYLLDGHGLIEVRTKEFQVRLLDRAKVKQERFKWQVINMALPLLLLFVFAGANNAVRKKKYG